MTVYVDGASKRYEARGSVVEALAPTSMRIDPREFVAFLGPSGCGKSTLLNLISGLEQPSQGQIFLGENEIKQPSYEIGMVFQQYTLFPWLTVLQNAQFAARLACNGPKGQLYNERPRTIFQRAEKLLELVGLEGFKQSYPSELSGGMKQRLAIVRALANRPQVLLMDEPFAALDTQTREEMQDMVKLLSQIEKTTVVFVTHDVEEALYLADRVFVFSPRPGRVVDEVPVPFGAKRELSLKLNEEFLALKRKLLDTMSEGVERSYDRERLLAMLDESALTK